MIQLIQTSTKRRNIIIPFIIVFVFLIVAVFVPLMANCQIISSYSNNTHINPTSFTLTVNSPNSQNQTFTNVVPFNLTINWTQYPSFSFPIPPAPRVFTTYAYAIDNNPEVYITSNKSSSDMLGYSNFVVNPTFSYLVNISSLANGYHKITITANLYGDNNLFFGTSTSPVQFIVQNPTPSSTTTIGSLVSGLTIVIIAVVLLVFVIALLLLRRLNRKSFHSNKPLDTQ